MSKYKLEDAEKFGWEGLKGWAYSSKDDFERASSAYFEVTGSHGRVRTSLSDRIYYVVDGVGEFDIDGERFEVRKTDVVIVPKNTAYDYNSIDGTLKLFLVHTPAFDEKFEERA